MHSPELGSYDAATTQRLDTGSEIGRRAHELFPGGILVEHEGQRHEDVMTRTLELLTQPHIPAIFEAAFTHAGVRVRVDVLERLPGGAWRLREAMSARRVKETHRHAVAVPRFVLEGPGLPIPAVEVIQRNTSCGRGYEGLDWRRSLRPTGGTALA